VNRDAPVPEDALTTDVLLLAGRYQLLDKLGQGGMGTVFRARDTKLDRHVAVKMLPADSAPDKEAVARFQREAKALARLSHPGIIQAHDSGEEAGRPFLIMELVEGRSLAAMLREQGRIASARAADFAYQAALALNHAHQSGLVHRDVKPSNLLLSADGRVRLLDLGLARFLQDQISEAQLTRTGMGMGTPDYVAPEQLRDARHADARSDIYSLGCTLYHLIAGRVPFPGSSFSEKVEAHETKVPPPLDEQCPDMSGGLALAVERMMAKLPADRFQSMAEVADALAPYVATSSPSFRQLRNNSTWDGSRLATMPAIPRRRRTAALVGAGALLAAVLVGSVILAVGLANGWFRPAGVPIAQREDSSNETQEAPLAPADTGKLPSDTPPQKSEPRDPNILTISKEVKDGGTYRTIGDALRDVHPGQTVLVLDDATYAETVVLTQSSVYSGITLAAPRHATLAIPGGTHVGVQIVNIPRLVLSGFHIRANGPVGALVVVSGQTLGVSLDDLDLHISTAKGSTGVSLEAVRLEAGMPPVSVRGCRFQGGDVGLQLSGTPDPSHGLLIHGNTFAGVNRGLLIRGDVGRTAIVGNRFLGAGDCGLQLAILDEKTDSLLIANNTFLECSTAVRLVDTEPKGSNIRLCANLILGTPRPDFLFVHWSGRPDDPVKAGDGRALARAWRIDHNWREVKGPPDSDPDTEAWVPPDSKNGDVRHDEIKGVSRDSKSSDFLRPDPKSKLATEGAGNEDPSLPRHVGALPPEGTDPWDWDRTWRMPKKAQLLTVSKDSSGSGTYHTINEALQKASPWATIRVLDAATYEESISLSDRKKYEGLTLEAVNGATLHMGAEGRSLIVIDDVPHVCVAGFRCTESGSMAPGAAGRTFVVVSGAAQGIALTRLTLTPKTPMIGITLQNALVPPGELPLRVEQCTIRPECPMSNDGISVAGALEPDTTGGICIRTNRIISCAHGINLRGALRDVHVTGNILVKCAFSGLRAEDVAPGSRGLLFANNTAFAGGAGFRLWYNTPYKELQHGQVEIANNLFFAATDFDVAYVLNDVKNTQQSPGNGEELLKMWHFHHNRRDLSGSGAAFLMPMSPDDSRFKRDEMLSVAKENLDRVRPTKDSPLATQGAGTKDSSLPVYIGALPREGDSVWDWDRTWRMRVRKAEEKR
jgi:serine/threonine protein kinase/nitrous oxidase accessory protein NosD